MNATGQTALKVGLPVVILLIAGAVTARLIASRDEPGRSDPEQQAAVVETEIAHLKEHRLDVRAHGSVEPARTSTIRPQVGGKIVDVHDNLEPGGLVEKGDVLVQIDRSDYILALEQRKTALEQAKSQLAIEKGQQEIAEREWKLFKKEAGQLTDESDSSLALRKPQLANAQAQVNAAQSRVEQAELNLSRTTIRAPFDGMIQEESVAVGDLASSQTRLASLVASDVFWARLSIPPDKLPYIDIPNVNADNGSNVTISYEVGERSVQRQGRVLRLVGGLDPAGRLARILVAIQDPLGLEDQNADAADSAEVHTNARGIPLLLNSYVDARIQGNTTRELIELPRSGVRSGDQIYLFDDGKLAIRQLDIVWRRPETVLVASGVEDDDRVIVGPMPQPLEGMPVKRADADSAADDAAGETAARERHD